MNIQEELIERYSKHGLLDQYPYQEQKWAIVKFREETVKNISIFKENKIIQEDLGMFIPWRVFNEIHYKYKVGILNEDLPIAVKQVLIPNENLEYWKFQEPDCSNPPFSRYSWLDFHCEAIGAISDIIKNNISFNNEKKIELINLEYHLCDDGLIANLMYKQ